MNYVLKTIPQKFFIGIAVKTSNDPGKAEKDIPLLWEKFYREKVLEKIPNKKSSELYALYTDYEGDYTKPYSCIIGCETSSLDVIPKGMVGKELSASPYAVFTAKGEFPISLINTWKEIWNTSLKRTYEGDFEAYPLSFNPQNKPELKIYISIYK